MKIRIDFVSNSSSSSFIVITDSGRDCSAAFLAAEKREVSAPDCELGEAAFGWQTEKYHDFWSKLNWCAIVISAKREMEEYESSDGRLSEEVARPWFRAAAMEALLKKTCSAAGLNVELCEIGGDMDCYIDHQSNIGSEPANARMFASEKALHDFLFNDGSYIDNSNDNGGRDDDEYDFQTGRYLSQPDDYYKVDS